MTGGGEARRPLIGVIGGLGPAATVDFYAKAVALSAASGAATDQEHVRLLIEADPEVPNRNESVAGTGPSSAPALVAKARRLKAAGAELLVMVCNAAHAYRADIEDATGLRLVSIVDEAVAELVRTLRGLPAAPDRAGPGDQVNSRDRPGSRDGVVGVLAAAGTLDAGLYREALAARGMTALEPSGELRSRFMDLLYRIKSGDTSRSVRAGMAGVAAELVAGGAAALVAACTEVPLVLDPSDVSVPLIDATAALAAAVVRLGSGSTV